MGFRQLWNWLLNFGCNGEEANETTEQILELTTRSTTFPFGDERDACRLSDEDTVDTILDSSLETRIGEQFQSRTDLNLVENDRVKEECGNPPTHIFDGFLSLFLCSR